MNEEKGPSDVLARYLVEQSPDGIIFADREGIIRLWNPGAERIFGYSCEEALGKTLDLVIPERFRDAHWSGYRQPWRRGRRNTQARRPP